MLRIAASGVRSSWEASDVNRCNCSKDCSMRDEHRVEDSREVTELVLRIVDGQALVQVLGINLLRRGAPSCSPDRAHGRQFCIRPRPSRRVRRGEASNKTRSVCFS